MAGKLSRPDASVRKLGAPQSSTGGRTYRFLRERARGLFSKSRTLLAVNAIRKAGIDLRGTLKCVYTADEEKNGPYGLVFMLDECGLDADYTIVCEPTGWTRPDGQWGMGIAVANGGNFLVEIETGGIKTRLWRPNCPEATADSAL